eukprot:322620-Pyramimonas_sp.AAC.1
MRPACAVLLASLDHQGSLRFGGGAAWGARGAPSSAAMGAPRDLRCQGCAGLVGPSPKLARTDSL